MNVLYKLGVLAIAVSAAGAASAASQGTPGATSTGTFVNTFKGSAPQVQILGLKDAVVSRSSGKVPGFFQDAVGALDTFCVVNTGGGATKLSFKNKGGGTNGGFFAYSADGSWFSYWLSLWYQGGARSSRQLLTNGFIVPGSKAVRNSTSCGSGNIYKSVIQGSGMDVNKTTKTFTDTVTVVATPQ